MIRIIDCGSQLTQNIARRIREEGVFSDIVPYKTPTQQVLREGLDGIIISGGQFSVYDDSSPRYERELLESGVPVLGICYGQQSIAHLLGGKVEPAKNREYGKTRLHVRAESPLFQGVPQLEFNVWMSHGDIVTELPDGFEKIADSEGGHTAAMHNLERNIYAVQFHPEVDHTEYGRKVLSNFLSICNARKDWSSQNFIENTISRIQEQAGDGLVIAGVSGGVDSTTLAAIMQKALGDRFYAIFVDNGLLRKNEAEEVSYCLAGLGVNFIHVNAQQRFLQKLEGVRDPDEKRRIIGHEFIAVFEEQARRLNGVEYLGQGTLYPDVIESVPIFGSSSKIKRHHNVGGLPEKMGLKLIEPFREMFKDEVRKIATTLGMPPDVVYRHPFPGPGLAVRVIGEITPQKLGIVREADAIFMDELRKRNLYYEIAQAFAALPETRSVGVMGDEGNYQAIIALRAVTTNDFMTSDIYRFEWDDLQAITNRIINEVNGVNRVVYDTTQKPPGTIEWE
ncbi:glutamine-hydrolyzing GMP synthase [Candidatus Woesearchaeota archaeon]|nr:glutamine-hydrolyzing GMP synthase [Candidatus Woesearchaeota archaeon]